MTPKYKKLYDLVSTIKVLCTVIAVAYLIYWFLMLFPIPYMEYVSLVFSPVISIIEAFYVWEINYNGQIINMSPAIAAVVFQILYFVCGIWASAIEKMEERYQKEVYEKRKLEEKLVNQDLKEIFKRKTLRYTRFAILLSLDLQSAIMPGANNENDDLKDIAMKEYVKIISAMRKKYNTCKAITPDKLFILYDNFALFDDFFSDMLKEVGKICEINKEKNVNTSFLFAIEAMDDNDKIANVLELLEKVATFHYSNKAVATSAFNVRYDLNQTKKYNLETMGISRLFEKNPDGTQTSKDIELFNLKPKKK